MTPTFPIKVPITAVDRFSKVLGKMGGEVGRWGSRLSKAGKSLTLGLTVPTIALGVASAKTGLTFQRSLNRVAAETSASAEQMAGLRSQAELLAGQTHSLTEVAEAQALLAEKGEDVLSIQQQTPAVLKLATIANVDLADGVEILTDSLELYGKGADEAASMTDLLAAASQRTSLTNLLDALRVAGPRARATGQDLRTVISLLDVLADEGFEGAKGGAAVSAALAAMVKPGRAARKELEALHIKRSDLQTSEGKVRDLTEILELLEQRGAGSTQVLRIFGEAGPAVAALMEKKLVPAVRLGARTLEDVDGRAQQVVDTLRGGGVDSTTRFATAWEKVGISLAESGLLDMLAEGVRWVGDLAQKFRELSPATKRWIVRIGVVGAVTGPALVALGSLVTTVSALGGAFTMLGATKGALGSFIGKAAPWAALAIAIGSIASDVIDLVGAINGTNSEAAGGPKVDRPAVDALQFAGVATSGAPLGAERLGKMAAAGATGARGEVGGRIEVDFRDVPKGTKIKSKPAGDVDLDVLAGFNMGSPL